MFPRQPSENGLNRTFMEAAGIEPAQDSPGGLPHSLAYVRTRSGDPYVTSVPLGGINRQPRNTEWQKDRPGFVYLAQIGGHYGPIKVGWAAKNVDSRIATLQAGNHRVIRLVAVAPGTRRDESRIHMLMQEAYIRGDWFRGYAIGVAASILAQTPPEFRDALLSMARSVSARAAA